MLLCICYPCWDFNPFHLGGLRTLGPECVVSEPWLRNLLHCGSHKGFTAHTHTQWKEPCCYIYTGSEWAQVLDSELMKQRFKPVRLREVISLAFFVRAMYCFSISSHSSVWGEPPFSYRNICRGTSSLPCYTCLILFLDLLEKTFTITEIDSFQTFLFTPRWCLCRCSADADKEGKITTVKEWTVGACQSYRGVGAHYWGVSA